MVRGVARHRSVPSLRDWACCVRRFRRLKPPAKSCQPFGLQAGIGDATQEGSSDYGATAERWCPVSGGRGFRFRVSGSGFPGAEKTTRVGVCPEPGTCNPEPGPAASGGDRPSDYGASAERFSAIPGKKSERRKCLGGNALRDPVARRRADSLERLERVCAVHGGRSQVPGFGFRGSEKTTRTGSARNPEPATRNRRLRRPRATTERLGSDSERFSGKTVSDGSVGRGRLYASAGESVGPSRSGSRATGCSK